MSHMSCDFFVDVFDEQDTSFYCGRNIPVSAVCAQFCRVQLYVIVTKLTFFYSNCNYHYIHLYHHNR